MTNSYAPLIFTAPDGGTITVGDPRIAGSGGGGGEVSVSNAPGRLVAASGDESGITDSQAVQAALDAAGEEGGGIVWLDGHYWINKPILLTTGASLRGTGWHRTVLHLTAGANSSMIIGPEGAYWYEIRDMQLDGHKEDQTGGNAGIELVSNTAPDGEMASCGVPLIERVLVRYTHGDGIYSRAVEARHSNCFVFRAGGYGFHADRSDMWYTDCTVGESTDHGFYFSPDGTECRMSGCKSWWSGYGAPRGEFAWKTTTSTLLNEEACGYYISTGADHQQIVNCEAQDPAKHGFAVYSNRNRIDGEVSRNEGSNVAINGSDNRVRLTTGHHSPIAMGLRASPDSLIHITNGHGNDIEVGWVDAGDTHQIEAGITGNAPTDLARRANRIILGTPWANTTEQAWMATIPVDPIVGGARYINAAGPTTVQNPPGDRNGAGMEFSLSIRQDAAGGHAVSFGTDFQGVTPADTGASRTSVWTFRCNGPHWVQTSFYSY